MTVVSTVETARFTLGGRRREDFAEYASLWGDAEVTRRIGGKPLSEEDAWGRFVRMAGHRAPRTSSAEVTVDCRP
jgi:RimJ/RimL family protein N-acetyltransferase